MSIETFEIKKNDLQPYYYAQVKDAEGAVVDITSATIYCTMRQSGMAAKIDRQTTGISITDATNGKFEYQWQADDTDTVGEFEIEFEINPASGGKFTVPAKTEDVARVLIIADLDET